MGRQKQRLENNTKEWTGMNSVSSASAAEDTTRCEKGCCKVICGAPKTLQGY